MAKRAARKAPTFIQRSRALTAEQKALFHQTLGAGKSKVKRPFLGVTPAEREEIDRRIEALIDREVQRRWG